MVRQRFFNQDSVSRENVNEMCDLTKQKYYMVLTLHSKQLLKLIPLVFILCTVYICIVQRWMWFHTVDQQFIDKLIGFQIFREIFHFELKFVGKTLRINRSVYASVHTVNTNATVLYATVSCVLTDRTQTKYTRASFLNVMCVLCTELLSLFSFSFSA